MLFVSSSAEAIHGKNFHSTKSQQNLLEYRQQNESFPRSAVLSRPHQLNSFRPASLRIWAGIFSRGLCIGKFKSPVLSKVVTLLLGEDSLHHKWKMFWLFPFIRTVVSSKQTFIYFFGFFIKSSVGFSQCLKLGMLTFTQSISFSTRGLNADQWPRDSGHLMISWFQNL